MIRNDFITLMCPTCSAQLNVEENAERATCQYCLQTHVIKRQNGTASLAPIESKLSRMEAEIAIPRLRQEVDALVAEHGQVKGMRPPKASKQQNALLWISLILMFVVTPIGLSAQNPEYIITGAVGGFVLFGWFLYMVTGKVQQFYTWQKSELSRLQSEMDSKQKRLSAHYSALE